MVVDPPHIDQITLPLDEAWTLCLHPRFTVVSGISVARRQWMVAALGSACTGLSSAASVSWVDAIGRPRLVLPSSREVPGVVVLSDELGHPTVRELADWVARARGRQTETPTLVVLVEPFAWCTDDETWDRLEVLERASRSVQVLLFSDDPCVLAWAEHRLPEGTVALVEHDPLEDAP
jgi:hypothetical protein